MVGSAAETDGVTTDARLLAKSADSIRIFLCIIAFGSVILSK
jgi:hypothetical protein